jgi:hypothetical protein
MPAQRLRVGRRRKFAMTAIMINIFDGDIDVLVACGLLPVHLRDSSDSIAQAIQYALGVAMPALADGSLPVSREKRQRPGSRAPGDPMAAKPRSTPR